MSDRRQLLKVTSVASGTLASRVSGLLRVLVLAWVLGLSPLADAFNLANTIPNMVFDLVLGGVMSATFIPVFVERLARDSTRQAWKSISTIVTGALVVLLVATVLAWWLAPEIVTAFTSLHHGATTRNPAQLAQQRDVTTSLLRWFAPQIFFYGLIGIASALLNVRQRFGAPAWVPVANNVVCIAVLFWFHAIDPVTGSSQSLNTTHLTLLGLGTTLGVVIQALLLTPSLARADLWRLSLRFDRRDPALRQIGTLAGWSLGLVVANQVSLFFVLAFAFALGGDGPVSAYTYGWSFMQMPYAVVVVSVLNVLTPELAALASREEWEGFRDRLARGLRQSLVIIVPLSFYLVVLAQPLVALLLHHGDGRIHLAAGGVLAVLAVGLPGFTVFQVCIRGLQSMQRARDTFGLYLFQNVATVAGIFLFGRHRIEGLVGAISLAYALGAAVALVVVRRRRASVAHVLIERGIVTSVVVSFATALVVAVVYNLYGWSEGLGLATRFIAASLVGAVLYLATMAIWARRSTPRGRKGVRL